MQHFIRKGMGTYGNESDIGQELGRGGTSKENQRLVLDGVFRAGEVRVGLRGLKISSDIRGRLLAGRILPS